MQLLHQPAYQLNSRFLNIYMSKLIELRTQVLIDGFKKELAGRLETLKSSRVELEKLYSARVDDAHVDKPEHSEYKEMAMIALCNCESNFTTYAGSIRSIKSVVDT